MYTVASSDSEEENVEREIDDDSSDGDGLNEQRHGEVDEDGEGVQLFARQAPLSWRKGGVVADKKTERRRRKKKRKKLDKETKDTLRRQEVSKIKCDTIVLVTPPIILSYVVSRVYTVG